MKIGQLSVDVLGNPAEFVPALELSWEKWDVNNAQRLVWMEQAGGQESESWFDDNPYNQASPGILVQFAIMELMTSAQILVQERKSSTLRRLMTIAMKPWEILVGHILGMFIIVFSQMAQLIIFGQLLLGVKYLREPVCTLLVSLALGGYGSSWKPPGG